MFFITPSRKPYPVAVTPHSASAVLTHPLDPRSVWECTNLEHFIYVNGVLNYVAFREDDTLWKKPSHFRSKITGPQHPPPQNNEVSATWAAASRGPPGGGSAGSEVLEHSKLSCSLPPPTARARCRAAGLLWQPALSQRPAVLLVTKSHYQLTTDLPCRRGLVTGALEHDKFFLKLMEAPGWEPPGAWTPRAAPFASTHTEAKVSFCLRGAMGWLLRKNIPTMLLETDAG